MEACEPEFDWDNLLLGAFAEHGCDVDVVLLFFTPEVFVFGVKLANKLFGYSDVSVANFVFVVGIHKGGCDFRVHEPHCFFEDACFFGQGFCLVDFFSHGDNHCASRFVTFLWQECEEAFIGIIHCDGEAGGMALFDGCAVFDGAPGAHGCGRVFPPL